MALMLSIVVTRDVKLCRGQLTCLYLKLNAPRSFQTSGYVTLPTERGKISEDQNAKQIVADFPRAFPDRYFIFILFSYLFDTMGYVLFVYHYSHVPSLPSRA